MKQKLLLLIAAATSLSVHAAQSLPYTSPDMNGWTGYVSSGADWQYMSTTPSKPSECDATGYARLWRVSEESGLDGWLTSPELELEAGKTYDVSFYYIIWGSTETKADFLEVRCVPESVTTADDATKMTSLPAFYKNDEKITGTSNTTWHKVERQVQPDENQRFISFRIGGGLL